MAVNIITKFVLGQFAKRSARKSEGIATLLKASDPVVQSNVRTIEIILKNMGIDPKNLKSTDDVLKHMNYHKAMMNQHLKQDFKELGLNFKGKFGEHNVYQQTGTKNPFQGMTPRIQQDVDSIIKDLKNMEPMAAMKESNLIIGRKVKYKNLSGDESQRILKETDDHIFQRDIKYDEFGDPIKPDPEDMASGGRVPLMYGGDPGFAFEYGGSWADWHDQHRDQMPVEQYIKTKLPKHRLPFREMQSGGIAQLSRPGYFFGGPAKGKKALKAIMDAFRANKTWGVGGPPYHPEKTSFNIKEMTKRNLGTELSLTDLRELSKSPLAPQGGKGHFEDFNRQFKNIKASILKQKLEESKINAEAMISSAKMVPAEDATAKKVQAQFTREGKKQLEEAIEGLKEIDIYMGMLQKQGRSVHQSGGLAYMLGEPTYMKYGAGGSVGHAPWHMPTGQPQQQQQLDTPPPQIASRPDPLKAPRGIPSVAPKNMDPAYMQQQMMQKAMMGQGPRPMAAEGGRIGFKLGGIDKGRRAFMKWLAGIMGTGVAAGTGLLKLGTAAKVAKPAAAVTETIVKSNAAGMPAWFPSLVRRVLKEGKDETEKLGTLERQTVHTTKLPTSGTEIQVTRDLATDDIIVDIGMGKHGWPAGRHGQPAQLVLKKGEWIEPSTTGGGYMTKGGENVYPGMSKGFSESEKIITKPGKSSPSIKSKDEFTVQEAEFTGGHPENVKFEETVDFNYGDHGSDFSEVERFATGKKKYR